MFKITKNSSPHTLSDFDRVVLRIMFVLSFGVFLLFMSSTLLALFDGNMLLSLSSFCAAATMAYFLVFTKSLLSGYPCVLERFQFFLAFASLVFFTQAAANTLFLCLFGIVWLHGLVILSCLDRFDLLMPSKVRLPKKQNKR